MINTVKNPIANPTMVLREEFDDWAIFFNPDTGDAYGMNPVSVLIWKYLDGKHSPENLVELVKKQCDEVPPEVNEHVTNFIKELTEKGFAGYEN